jgi:hypothetical protein
MGHKCSTLKSFEDHGLAMPVLASPSQYSKLIHNSKSPTNSIKKTKKALENHPIYSKANCIIFLSINTINDLEISQRNIKIKKKFSHPRKREKHEARKSVIKLHKKNKIYSVIN